MTGAATKAAKRLGAFLPGHKVSWMPPFVTDDGSGCDSALAAIEPSLYTRDARDFPLDATITSVAGDGGPLEKNGYVRVFLESDKIHRWVRKDELLHRNE